MVAVFAQRTMITIAVDRDAERSFDLSLYLSISKRTQYKNNFRCKSKIRINFLIAFFIEEGGIITSIFNVA